MVAERLAVCLGAPAGRVVLPARPTSASPWSLGLVGSWLLARRIKRQTLGPGAARDRRPRRAPRGDAARHRRGRHRARPAAPDHPGQRRRPAACSTCPSTRSGSLVDDLRIEGRLRDVLVGESTAASRAADGSARRRRDRARDEVVIRRGRVLVMNRMRSASDGRRARHGDDAARPHRAGRPRAARSARSAATTAAAARAGPRVRQPAAHHLAG